MHNPFFDALEKIAKSTTEFNPESHEIEPRETYDPARPMMDELENDVIEEAALLGETTPASEEHIEEVMDHGQPIDHGYVVPFHQVAWLDSFTEEEKIAAFLPEYGAVAQLLVWSQDDTSPFQKEAQHILGEAFTSEERYSFWIDKVAAELFEGEENQAELYSPAGAEYVIEQLAQFVDSELHKVANAANQSFATKLTDGFNSFVEAGKAFFQSIPQTLRDVPKTKAMEEQRGQLKDKLSRESELLAEKKLSKGMEKIRAYKEHFERTIPIKEELIGLDQRLRNARIAKGLAYGAGAAGSLYAGKKIYDMFNKDEQQKQSSDNNNLLISKMASGTLNSEYRNGGLDTMSKEIVRDFLKLAGAAALIELANNEALDMEIRKEASDQFDAIANLGRSQMDEAFVKTAQALYGEDQLHQIVAGAHTEEIFDKLAFFFEANEMSVDELNKVANAGGVAAKGVAGALTDAAKHVSDFISQGKEKAQGAAREYVGKVKDAGKAYAGSVQGSPASHAATGLAGGGLVAGGLAGYNAIKNPAQYDIEQTAAMVEEAVLAKQAAIETYRQADEFIKKYTR